MKAYTENILPDALTGAIFAIEGIKDAITILNGPTGCKFYHAAISDTQYIRNTSYDPLSFPEDYYFGQPRVPCTWLDDQDYIYGSEKKLTELIQTAVNQKPAFIAVINSPGAALIGDDITAILDKTAPEIPHIAIENTGYSKTFMEGYNQALQKGLKVLCKQKTETQSQTINLIGFHIYQKYYDQNILEIKRLLSLCGIKVISTIAAGDNCETLSQAGEASLNVVVFEEYGLALAKQLKTQLDMPFIVLEAGPPIGFEATEKMICQICTALKKEPQKALDCINQGRARAYLFLARYASLIGGPKGNFFSIKADASTAFALSQFLEMYLGMIPAAIEITEGSSNHFAEQLKAGLKQKGCAFVLDQKVNATKTQIVFADGSTIAQLKLQEKNDATLKTCGIEIALPSLGYLDIVPKTLFGDKGTLFILENIMNGLRFLT